MLAGARVYSRAGVKAELAGQHGAIPGEVGIPAAEPVPIAKTPQHRPAAVPACGGVIQRPQRQPEGQTRQHAVESEGAVLNGLAIGLQNLSDCRSPGQGVGQRLWATGIVHAGSNRPVGDIGNGQCMFREDLIVEACEAGANRDAFSVGNGQRGRIRLSRLQALGQGAKTQQHRLVIKIIVFFGPDAKEPLNKSPSQVLGNL